MKNLVQKLTLKLWSSRGLERILLKCLARAYREQFRLQWEMSPEAPHFFCQHWNAFRMVDGTSGGPGWLMRGVYASEVIDTGARVLDIGCGDGFFTREFLSVKASHVDAVDIEPSAIDHARAKNPAPSIQYHVMDASKDPFPAEQYDVVVWDGAIGHFSSGDAGFVLNRIAEVLAPSGIFCGSESLGNEGHDHLQFFQSEEDLSRLMFSHFPFVGTRTHSYDLQGGFCRNEVYWRCARERNPLEKLQWTLVERPCQ